MTLSFMQSGKWKPARSGDYRQDNATGRAYADEMLKYIADTQNPLVFGTIVRAITEGGEYGGVEVGFCSRVGVVLAVNARVAA